MNVPSWSVFANAFWVFVGIVAGAFIQFLLNWLTLRSQRKNAGRALDTEIQLNINHINAFRDRIKVLRERISAGQVQDQDLFLSMQGFDYSIVSPLVAAGHFHIMLGPERVNQYFDFMRFFNNENGKMINSMLVSEHANDRSLAYLEWLDRQATQLSNALTDVRPK